jgi:phosphoglycolate phosphatase-like HAD superfamily hydrolase
MLQALSCTVLLCTLRTFLQAALAMDGTAFTPVTLVTFDVDGTLVKGTSVGLEVTAHSRAFMHAVGRLFSEDGAAFEQKYSTPLHLIPEEKYHGCTDGLISLNIVKYAFNIPAVESSLRLPEIFQTMYDFIAALSDDEVVKGIKPLPGVLDTLRALALRNQDSQGDVICGLVTGNVEGIARKKMRACGIFQTGVLHAKADCQKWEGEDAHSFLGGFGSDFCSGDIDDQARLYKDRGEQIAIAYRRAVGMLLPHQRLVRVVHVGDAPSDVLAAKYCFQEARFGPGVSVGCVGVATGSYSAERLQALAGEAVPGWDPVILAEGLADPGFIEACGIVSSESVGGIQ